MLQFERVAAGVQASCSHQHCPHSRPAAVARHSVPRRHHRQRCSAFGFKNPFRQSGEESGTYASQQRDDYTADDVEQYFNYMGMLAAEGTYDRLQAMLDTGTAAVDLLLLMAAGENDAPKVAELIRAGANLSSKDMQGKSAGQLATAEDVQAMLKEPELARSSGV